MANNEHRTSIKISAEDRATAVFKHVEQQLAGLEKESKTLNDGLSRLSGGFFTLKNAIIGVGVGASIKSLVDANQQILGLSTSFKAALGSAQAADKELEFLRALTNKLGLEFYSTAEQVRGFLVASNAMGMSTETSRKVITGLGEAAAAMGLTTEKTSLAMLALQQMMSKGVVSSEELRRQLGDLVPGAFQTAARAMGMTTAELDKAMKAGTVLASDLLPRLAEEWHKMFGAAAIEMSTSAVSEINRLKTAFTDLKIELAEGQFIDTFKSSVVGLTEYIQDHEQELVGTFQGMVEAGAQLGATIVPALEDTAGVLVKIANAVSKLPEPVIEALFGAAIGYKVGGKAGAVLGAIGVPLFSNLDSLETYQKQLKNAQDALEYQLKLYDDADPIIARTRKEIANLEAQIAKLTKTQQDANEATYDYYAELERLATEDPFDSLFSGTSENIKKVGDESEKASKKLKTFADSIIEKTRTPIEAYTVQVGKLEQAHKAGYLTLEVFNRALSMEKENLDKANRALQDAVDWTDYYAGELEKLYAGATDESEFFKDEVVNNNEEIKDSTEETWQQCGDIVSDFFQRVIGEGDDLVDWMDDLGRRITGAIAGDFATIGFNAIFGIPGTPTATGSMLTAGLSAMSSGSGIFGSIPGLPSVAASATSFLGAGSISAGLDASSIMAMQMAGVIDPATAQAMLSGLAPASSSFGASTLNFLSSYGLYGAAGAIGYPLLAPALGLPMNEPALASLGAGGGAMAGAAIGGPIGAILGAITGGSIFGSLGGADHEARRDKRGAAWLEAFTGLTSIEDLSDLTAAMPESWGGLPYESRDDTAAKVQYAGYEHTVLESQMTKSDYDATLAHFDDMAAGVAATLDEQGNATEATAAALAEYRDEIELTGALMEDWGHDAQAAGQALIAFYGTLSAGAIEDYFAEVYAGAMSLAEAMALLNDMGMTPLEASTAAVAQALSDLLGVTAETSGSIAEMYDVLLASLEAQADYNLYAADMAAIQTALTSGYEFTEEELGILVYYYQQLEAVLAGDIEVTEEFINAQTLANGVIQDASGYWDALALSIDQAQLKLQGFTDLDTSTMAMLERYVIPDLMATTGPANPDEPSIEIPTGQSMLNAYGSPEAALSELSWLPEWFKTASDTDIEWMAQHFYPELENSSDAVAAFTADVVWLDEQFKQTAEDQIAIQAQLEDQYMSIRNSLQADIMQATLSPQDYAYYQLGTQYGGYQTGIEALRAAGVSEEALGPLQDLLDHWYDIQSDAIDKLYMVDDKFGLTITELDQLAGSWQNVLAGIQNQELSLLTGIANPADAFDRLGIARSAIDEYTGGMSMESYLSGLSPEDQIKATQDLQGLLGDYLSIAQEAYERPSPEYQAIFDDVIDGLGTLEQFATDQLSDIDIQMDQLTTLQSIDEGVWALAEPSGSTETGTTVSSSTGSDATVKSSGDTTVIYLTVNATGTAEENAKAIWNHAERFMRSSKGRVIIQKIAAGK